MTEIALNVANALAAMILGPFLVPAAVATGNQEALCKELGGVYTPTATDVCPGGQWIRVVDNVVRAGQARKAGEATPPAK
jgi:hypothetical protein